MGYTVPGMSEKNKTLVYLAPFELPFIIERNPYFDLEQAK